MIFLSTIVWLANREPVYIEQTTPEPEVITVYQEVLVHEPVENTAYYKEISLTEDERLLLGKVIYAEAGNQTSVGKRAVVEVIFNRMLSDEWPDTLTGVITQQNPRQFADAGYVSEDDARAQFEYIDAVLREDDPILREDVVYFATYNANGTFYEQIGAHYFCY